METPIPDEGLKQYMAEADKLWKHMPIFNTLQLRWFENLLATYKEDLVRASIASVSSPSEESNKILLRAATFVEILEFQVQQLKTKVK